MPVVALILALLTAAPAPPAPRCDLRPASSLQGLVCRSELVVVATVTQVKGLFRWRRATARVEQAWLGAAPDTLAFHAATSLLDASDAVLGERVVLFLARAPDDELWTIVGPGVGRLPIDTDAEPPRVTLDGYTLWLGGDAHRGLHGHRAHPPLELTPARLKEHVETGVERHHTAMRRLAEAVRASVVGERLAPAPAYDCCHRVPALGAERARALFDRVRAADHDPELQRAWLRILHQSALAGELPATEVDQLAAQVREALGPLPALTLEDITSEEQP